MKIEEIIRLCKHYLERLFSDLPFQKITIGGLASLLFGEKVFALFTLILIIIDFITGVIKAKKLNDKIESAKFRNTILKIYIYYSLILTLNIVSKMTGLEIILRIGYSFIAITEGKSIIENLIIVYPGLSEIKSKLYMFYDNKEKEKGDKKDNNSL